MPSWNDGDSSSQSYLGNFMDMDYAPGSFEDPSFCGIAKDCPELYRVHKLEPVRHVAFEGINTGHRFYLCQMQNEVENYGFVAWVDNEWPDATNNALANLWGMYDDTCSARIDEKVENAQLLKQMSDEKNKLDKKYTSLLVDVKKFIEEIENKALEENLSRMNDNNEALMNMVDMLKNMQKYQADVIKEKRKQWDEDQTIFKEEKRKLEYALYELFKANDANKDKLKKIKNICDG